MPGYADHLWERMRFEFPGVRLVPRSSFWLTRLMDDLLGYRGFTTTIGMSIYVAEDFHDRDDESRYATLMHEREHLRQWRGWPLGPLLWLLNYVLFALAYLLLGIPGLWTMRWQFERAGYLTALRAEHEVRPFHPDQTDRIEYAVATMEKVASGPPYFFMAKRGIAGAWLRAEIEKLIRGE